MNGFKKFKEKSLSKKIPLAIEKFCDKENDHVLKY